MHYLTSRFTLRLPHLFAFALATGVACAGESPELDPADFESVDAYIGSIPHLESRTSEISVGVPGPPFEDGDYRCIQTPISEVREHSDLVAFAANSNALWPGSIVRGDAVVDGELAPLAWDRKPLTFSVSLENLDGNKSATLEKPSLATYREALGELLANEVTGATAAQISSEVEIVHSEQQLALALGASGSWPTVPASIRASLDFSDDQTRSRYLVKFTQAYFTIDANPPLTPSDYIADSVTVTEVADSLGESPPVYVSSITYGRRVIFSFASKHSAEEIAAALDFTYNGGPEISGDLSLTHKELLDSTEISAYIVGGSGASAVKAIGSYDAMVEFIQSGGNYSKDSPGAPIAYKLAYLDDSSPARLSFTSDYDRTSCERVSQNILATLESISVVTANDLDDSIELSASMLAVGTDGGQLWSGQATIGENTTYPTAGTLGELVVPIDAGDAGRIRFTTYATDEDTFVDEVACNSTVDAEGALGFRRLLTIRCAENGNLFNLNLRLRPVN